MSTAPHYQPHYTVGDYRHWEGRWELWQGLAVAMSPSPFGRHAKVLARTVAQLQGAIDAAACDATVLVEIDWIVARNTVLRPDVIVVCGSEPARHVEQVPPLVVEILSEETRERDLTFKLELYREQGVAWYLVIDPEAGHLRGLSLIPGGRYVDRAAGAARPLTIKICDGCEFSLDAERLFACLACLEGILRSPERAARCRLCRCRSHAASAGKTAEKPGRERIQRWKVTIVKAIVTGMVSGTQSPGRYDGDSVGAAIRFAAIRHHDGIEQIDAHFPGQPAEMASVVVADRMRQFHYQRQDAMVVADHDQISAGCRRRRWGTQAETPPRPSPSA